MSDTKYVYLFNEYDEAMAKCDDDWEGVRSLLGGKGANLVDATRLGIPVPPGFTVTTEACNDYFAAGETMPEGLTEDVKAAVAQIEERTGKGFLASVGDDEACQRVVEATRVTDARDDVRGRVGEGLAQQPRQRHIATNSGVLGLADTHDGHVVATHDPSVLDRRGSQATRMLVLTRSRQCGMRGRHMAR